MRTRARRFAGGLLLALLLLALLGCGSGQPTHTPAPTSAHPATTPNVTPTPGITRVPYPWPMQPTTTALGTTVYRPTDERVRAEMKADFLTYWTWSGHAVPAVVLHFVPDTSQIPLLATAAAAGQLQAYAQQVKTSGQLVTYAGTQLVQTVSCTQDGMHCTNVYAFGLSVKTVYSTQTGAVLSQTNGTNFDVFVTILQVYTQELMRWQIGSIQVHEDSF